MIKKTFFWLGLSFFWSLSAMAQVTENPSVKRKSSPETYINKIEITDEFTVVYMKYVSLSLEQQMEDFLRDNPRIERQLRSLDPFTRRLYMEKIARQFREGSNTISFQPTSYLVGKDGRKFRFIKASNIPVSPQRQFTEPDKRYYFRVYFEKLAPGIEEIDIVESERDFDNSVSYWNFFGVEVNNPPLAAQPPIVPEKPAEPTETVPGEAVITLFGRVLDAETNEPLAAKIVCVAKDSNRQFDSLQTSRSGKFEFLVSPDDYIYYISADGYSATEEEIDLSFMRQNNALQRDFYLNPLRMGSEVPPVVEDTIEETPPVAAKTESTSPVMVDENTFRLDKVYFKVGEATILEESYPQLEGLLGMMEANPNLQIQVEGHTDNRGDSRLNKKLSLQRAYRVREYLIDNGISGDRIKFKGYGDTRPIAPNNTEESRQLNRRVEIVILTK